jgi:hypothetical protein
MTNAAFNVRRVDNIKKAIKERAAKGFHSVEIIGTLSIKEYEYFRDREFTVQGVNVCGSNITIIKW